MIFEETPHRQGFRVVIGSVFHTDQRGACGFPEIRLWLSEMINFWPGTARGRTPTSRSPGVDFPAIFVEYILLAIV